MSKLGDRIRIIRKKRGISQAQLADELDITRSAVGNYERGFREPDLDTIEAIADILDVSIGDLMGRDEYVEVGYKSNDNGGSLPAIKNTEEWRSLAPGWANMTKEERQRVVAVVKAMFPNRFDGKDDAE